MEEVIQNYSRPVMFRSSPVVHQSKFEDKRRRSSQVMICHRNKQTDKHPERLTIKYIFTLIF